MNGTAHTLVIVNMKFEVFNRFVFIPATCILSETKTVIVLTLSFVGFFYIHGYFGC